MRATERDNKPKDLSGFTGWESGGRERQTGPCERFSFFPSCPGSLGLGGSEPEKTSWMAGGALRAPNGRRSSREIGRAVVKHVVRLHFLEPRLVVALDRRNERGEQSRRVLGLTKRANGVFHAGMDGLRDIELLSQRRHRYSYSGMCFPLVWADHGRMRPLTIR